MFLKKKVNFEIHQQLTLSARDIEAGVISDSTGILPGSGSGKTDNHAKSDADAANAKDAKLKEEKDAKAGGGKSKGKRGGKSRTTPPPSSAGEMR